MKHHIDEARRIATNTLADANRNMANPKISKNPKYHHMLTDMANKAADTLDKLNKQSRNDYNDDYRNDTHDMARQAMDMVNKLLPKLDDMDDYNDVDNRRYGRGAVRVGGYTRRRPRMDYNDRYMDDYDDDDDTDDYPSNIKRRSLRTGRFVSRHYRGPKRRTGPYSESDNYDDMDYTDYHRDDYNDRRVADIAARTAADTARRMNDDRSIYPHYPHTTPVMTSDNRRNADDDYRGNTRSDRNDDNRGNMRSSNDDTSDRTTSIGPRSERR